MWMMVALATVEGVMAMETATTATDETATATAVAWKAAKDWGASAVEARAVASMVLGEGAGVMVMVEKETVVTLVAALAKAAPTAVANAVVMDTAAALVMVASATVEGVMAMAASATVEAVMAMVASATVEAVMASTTVEGVMAMEMATTAMDETATATAVAWKAAKDWGARAVEAKVVTLVVLGEGAGVMVMVEKETVFDRRTSVSMTLVVEGTDQPQSTVQQTQSSCPYRRSIPPTG